MKKYMWAGAVVLLLTVFVGLFFVSRKNGDECTVELFMFDTVCSITAYGDGAEEAVSKTFDRLEQIHLATNFYAENSEVSKINSARAGETIKLSRDLTEILDAAIKIENESQGAYDITVATVSELWDFKNEGIVPEPDKIGAALEFVGGEKLIFDKENMTIAKTADEVKIDLGGVAKGYAGDIAIETLKACGVSGAIVDLGGNITCFGINPNGENGKWRIGIQKPFAPTGEYETVVEISGGAVVTGGTYQRYFEKNGKKYHHIINPDTGYPAEQSYNSVTIVTDTGVYGDCLATACFVLGEKSGQALAGKYGAQIYFN